MPPRFDDLWRELPIHGLLVIGLPPPPPLPLPPLPGGRGRRAEADEDEDEDEDATVTVVVTDRFRYSAARQKTVAAFKVASALLHNDAAIEAKIADADAGGAQRRQPRHVTHTPDPQARGFQENDFFEPMASRLSRFRSASALFAAANSGFAFALFSCALIFLAAAFSPELRGTSLGAIY
jgi:hypothetical protein